MIITNIQTSRGSNPIPLCCDVSTEASYNTRVTNTIPQQTRGIHPMLFQSWATVFDAGPTLKQLWVDASCLLGICRRPMIGRRHFPLT